MSLVNKSFDLALRLLRDTTGAYYDGQGYLQQAGAAEPRFTFDPVTYQPKGILTEPATTNLCLRSEALNQSEWAAFRVSVNVNPVLAPDGTQTADQIVENTDTNTHTLQQDIPVSGDTTYTRSYFVKGDGSGRQVIIELNSSSNWVNSGSMRIDPDTGNIESVSAGLEGYGVEDVGRGWFRIWITGTTISTPPANLPFNLQLHDGTSKTYTGDGVSGAYFWGAQFEARGYPTGYVYTTSTTATRDDDSLNIAIDGDRTVQEWLDPVKGTIFIEVDDIESDASFAYIWLISETDNTGGEWLAVSWSSQTSIRVRKKTDGDLIAIDDVDDMSGIHKIAVTYDAEANTVGLSFDGQSTTGNFESPLQDITFSRVKIGRSGTEVATHQQHTRAFKYYPYTMTEAELNELTT